jgi:hypothetical protein
VGVGVVVDRYGRVAGGSFLGSMHVLICRMHASRFGGEGGGMLPGCRSGSSRGRREADANSLGRKDGLESVIRVTVWMAGWRVLVEAKWACGGCVRSGTRKEAFRRSRMYMHVLTVVLGYGRRGFGSWGLRGGCRGVGMMSTLRYFRADLEMFIMGRQPPKHKVVRGEVKGESTLQAVQSVAEQAGTCVLLLYRPTNGDVSIVACC